MKVDLVELLKDIPVGTKMYSPIFGEVTLDCVCDYISIEKCVYVKTVRGGSAQFDTEGHWMLCDFKSEEPMLFPSKEQRNWSEFKI